MEYLKNKLLCQGLIRLLENGAPFVVSSGGETVLHTAARAGQVIFLQSHHLHLTLNWIWLLTMQIIFITIEIKHLEYDTLRLTLWNGWEGLPSKEDSDFAQIWPLTLDSWNLASYHLNRKTSIWHLVTVLETGGPVKASDMSILSEGFNLTTSIWHFETMTYALHMHSMQLWAPVDENSYLITHIRQLESENMEL